MTPADISRICGLDCTAPLSAEDLHRACFCLAVDPDELHAHLDEVHPERAPTLVTPYEVLAKGPDRRMTVQHNIAADVVTTYGAAASWTKNGVAPAADLRPDLVEVARLENAVMFPAQFKQLLANLKVEGQEKVGERTAWVVSARVNRPLLRLTVSPTSASEAASEAGRFTGRWSPLGRRQSWASRSGRGASSRTSPWKLGRLATALSSPEMPSRAFPGN